MRWQLFLYSGFDQSSSSRNQELWASHSKITTTVFARHTPGRIRIFPTPTDSIEKKLWGFLPVFEHRSGDVRLLLFRRVYNVGFKCRCHNFSEGCNFVIATNGTTWQWMRGKLPWPELPKTDGMQLKQKETFDESACRKLVGILQACDFVEKCRRLPLSLKVFQRTE